MSCSIPQWPAGSFGAVNTDISKYRLLAVALLSVVGIGLLEPRLVAVGGGREPSGRQWAAQAGHGVVLATLGGWRTLTADLVWLKANLAWENEELARTRTWLDLTVAIDERPDYFWLNSSRIVAYDMPVWRGRNLPDAPLALRETIREEQAQQALAILDRAVAERGPNAAIYAEMAGIHWRVRQDPARAAEFFRRAAELPDAPFYAGRIHAEFLISLGRKREARDWLRHWLPRLRADDPEARRSMVVARLAELERELAAQP